MKKKFVAKKNNPTVIGSSRVICDYIPVKDLLLKIDMGLIKDTTLGAGMVFINQTVTIDSNKIDTNELIRRLEKIYGAAKKCDEHSVSFSIDGSWITISFTFNGLRGDVCSDIDELISLINDRYNGTEATIEHDLVLVHCKIYRNGDPIRALQQIVGLSSTPSMGSKVCIREQDIPALIQRLKNAYGSKGVKMNKTIFGEVYSFENQQIEIIFNRIKDSTARSVDQALDQLGIMDPKIKKLFDDDNMIKGRFELKTPDEFGKRIGLCVNLDRRMRDDIIHKLYTRYGNIECRRIVDAKGFAGDAYELETSDGVILSVIFEAHDPECLYGQPNTVENIDQEVDKLVKTFTDDLHTTSLE